ncbi:hypothetical protein [Photobacterium kishitanii]|uniref:Uncharacterized protein n=1 Tax=Photobacterium kishitanii TaxID=318456 RepID=A0A2T3KB17_9GAMM|nr:hypothetical protein [Photobacterium kishitanii]PSU89793.1 hypothetical protein C9J27_24230 [Photobacterium kishitanii]
MTTFVMTVGKTKFNAKLFNDEVVKIFNLKFVCYNNSLNGSMSWDGLNCVSAETKVKNAKKLFSERKRSGETLDYVIDVSTGCTSDRRHTPVFKATPEFDGVCTDSWYENLEHVGTLIKRNGRWCIESDLETLEQIRREDELERCRTGSTRFSDFCSSQDNEVNALLMRGHYEKLDADNGGTMVTRGFCLG